MCKHVFSGNTGSLLSALAPIALSFIAPGLGTALGGALDIGDFGGAALLGAGTGALSSGLSGGNILTGALEGGALGGIGNGISQGLDSLGGLSGIGDDISDGVSNLFGSGDPSGSSIGNSASTLGNSVSPSTTSLASLTTPGTGALDVGGGASSFGSDGSPISWNGDGTQSFTNSATSNGTFGNILSQPSAVGQVTPTTLDANAGMASVGSDGSPLTWNATTAAQDIPSSNGFSAVNNANQGLASNVNGSNINWNNTPLNTPAQGAASGVNWNATPTNNTQSGGLLSKLLGNSGGNMSSTGTSGILGNYGNVGTLLGDLNSYNAQNQIAQQQKAGYANAQGYLQPYLNTGTAANTQLANLLGLNGGAAGTSALSALQNTPGYQFALQQGQTGLDRSLAAQGLSNSGAALKATDQYNQGEASQLYQQALQNYASQSGAGQQAAGALGQYSALSGQANAAATGAQSNVINQGIGSLLGSNQPTLQQLLQSLTKSSY